MSSAGRFMCAEKLDSDSSAASGTVGFLQLPRYRDVRFAIEILDGRLGRAREDFDMDVRAPADRDAVEHLDRNRRGVMVGDLDALPHVGPRQKCARVRGPYVNAVPVQGQLTAPSRRTGN